MGEWSNTRDLKISVVSPFRLLSQLEPKLLKSQGLNRNRT
jgi:hypothetical protein